MPKIKIQGEMLDLAKYIISTKKGDFDPAAFDDRYEAALAELVKAKIEGKALPKRKTVEVSKPNDLLAALRESAGVGKFNDDKPKRTAANANKGAGPQRAARGAAKGSAASKAAPQRKAEADKDLIPLVQKLIKQKTARWSPDMVSDPIQESLLKLIAQKKKQLKPKKSAKGKKAENAPASNVVNIMDALRKSVEADLKKKKAS
jgi:non-homologous end joining protein Ku